MSKRQPPAPPRRSLPRASSNGDFKPELIQPAIRERNIPAQLAHAEGIMDELEARFSVLADNLHPILQPGLRGESEARDQSPAICPIGDRIGNINERMQQLLYGINDVVGRLEC